MARWYFEWKINVFKIKIFLLLIRDLYKEFQYIENIMNIVVCDASIHLWLWKY